MLYDFPCLIPDYAAISYQSAIVDSILYDWRYFKRDLLYRHNISPHFSFFQYITRFSYLQ